MFNLIPKEVRFFDYFEQQSQHIIRAGALLHEMIHQRLAQTADLRSIGPSALGRL